MAQVSAQFNAKSVSPRAVRSSGPPKDATQPKSGNFCDDNGLVDVPNTTEAQLANRPRLDNVVLTLNDYLNDGDNGDLDENDRSNRVFCSEKCKRKSVTFFATTMFMVWGVLFCRFVLDQKSISPDSKYDKELMGVVSGVFLFALLLTKPGRYCISGLRSRAVSICSSKPVATSSADEDFNASSQNKMGLTSKKGNPRITII